MEVVGVSRLWYKTEVKCREHIMASMLLNTLPCGYDVISRLTVIGFGYNV